MSQAIGPGYDEMASERCAACGEEIDPTGERGFAVGADEVLCFVCAMERGGSWDEVQQRWAVEPDYSDLGEGFD